MSYSDESQEELAQREFGSTDAAARAFTTIAADDVEVTLQRIDNLLDHLYEQQAMDGGALAVLSQAIRDERERLGLSAEVKV